MDRIVFIGCSATGRINTGTDSAVSAVFVVPRSAFCVGGTDQVAYFPMAFAKQAPVNKVDDKC